MIHLHKWVEYYRVPSSLVGGPEWEVFYICKKCGKSKRRFEREKVRRIA